MKKFSLRAALSAVLSLAFLVGASRASDAQLGPLASGHGSTLGQNQEVKVLTFAAFSGPGGSVGGSAVIQEPSSGGLVVMQISSAAFVGETLSMAGPIVVAYNSPPQFVVGATAFFSVQDNGDGTLVPDAYQGLGAVPTYLGNPTIQEILALLGPPPAFLFSPLLDGDIRIF